MGYSLLRPKMNRVSSHLFHGILTSIRELRRDGCQRIGFCIHRETSKRLDNIPLAAFQLAQSLYPDVAFSSFLFDDANSGSIPKWCRKNRLEVLIGAEPEILQVLRRSGLYPGKVGYATASWNHEEPEIAGLDQLPDQIGAKAVELLIGQLQRIEFGLPALACTTMVEGEWRRGPSLRRCS